MPRKPRVTPEDTIDPRFEGSAFSNQECLFLLENLGQAPIVALDEEEEIPEGVNEAAVRPILQRVHDLELYQAAQREKHGGMELEIYCGIPALRQVLEDTLQWRKEVAELKRRTRGSTPEMRRAAGAPSLAMWDPDTDIPYFGGIGADSDKVLTALGEGGVRIPLHTEIQASGVGAIKTMAGVAKFVKSKTQAEQQGKLAEITPNELEFINSGAFSAVKCPICGKAEDYETAKSSTKRAAMARMMQHLQAATVQRDQHRLLKTRVQGGRAGAKRNAAAVDALREAEAE